MLQGAIECKFEVLQCDFQPCLAGTFVALLGLQDLLKHVDLRVKDLLPITVQSYKLVGCLAEQVNRRFDLATDLPVDSLRLLKGVFQVSCALLHRHLLVDELLVKKRNKVGQNL